MILPNNDAAKRAKATCQKCLLPGHWSYECKNTATYQVRPSRTKQLMQKRLRQPFMEEEAPGIPSNSFLGDDRLRYGEPPIIPPPDKKTKKEHVKKKKKKAKKESSSSSSSSSDSDSSSSSSGSSS
eukprot:TRINITY_DN52924_c0_g1_i1.p1 TRINITY_DN52924_c0_g1~~TRINITY_DN52924_c0_g1_i1.p1  ORF type:complete len:126 (+),score=24.55 TRINITY_DN52924_c0_g1_i1:32-409(+)